VILRIDHELLEAQERKKRIYFCFLKIRMMKKKNYFIIEMKMKKSDFFVCKTVNEQKNSSYLLWPLFEIELADKYNDDEYD